MWTPFQNADLLAIFAVATTTARATAVGAFTHTMAPTQGAPLIVSTCPEACSDKLVVDEAVFVLARQVMMQNHIQSGT